MLFGSEGIFILQHSTTIQWREDDNKPKLLVIFPVSKYRCNTQEIRKHSPCYCSTKDMGRDINDFVSSSLRRSCFIASLLFSPLPGALASLPRSGSKGTCWDFSEGACDLSENNIIHHDRFVDSPEECQVNLVH